MKIPEFEAKLGTVSDDKLRQMLAASREHGPEVAVKLILAEGRKRGWEDGEAQAPDERAMGNRAAEFPEEAARMAVATSAYPKEVAGAFGADAPEPLSPALPDPGDAAAPALSPEWLTEETKRGMPVAVKVLLLIAAVGCVMALAWKFTR